MSVDQSDLVVFVCSSLCVLSLYQLNVFISSVSVSSHEVPSLCILDHHVQWLLELLLETWEQNWEIRCQNGNTGTGS